MKVSVHLHVNVYDLLREAINAGVEYGYNRAHKHRDEVTPEDIKDEIKKAVTDELFLLITLDGD